MSEIEFVFKKVTNKMVEYLRNRKGKGRHETKGIWVI